jgi:hypothetical protein
MRGQFRATKIPATLLGRSRERPNLQRPVGDERRRRRRSPISSAGDRNGGFAADRTKMAQPEISQELRRAVDAAAQRFSTKSVRSGIAERPHCARSSRAVDGAAVSSI